MSKTFQYLQSFLFKPLLLVCQFSHSVAGVSVFGDLCSSLLSVCAILWVCFRATFSKEFTFASTVAWVGGRGGHSWYLRPLIGRTDAEAETPVLWPPHAKSWLIGKDPDAGRNWGQEEKGTTEDEMAGWHHRLDGHEFE